MNTRANLIESLLAKLLGVRYIQFILGFLFIIVAPSLFLWGGNWQFWFSNSVKVHSFISMSLVYLFAFISVWRFTSYLGSLSFRLLIPVCLFALSLGVLALFVFRLSYSVYYISFASLLMLGFFSMTCYIRNQYHHRTIAYIPIGRIDDLPEVLTISWQKLSEPSISFDKGKVDVVMADLRSSLSDEWQHFLAECTLQQIPVFHSSRLLEMVSGRVKIDHLYENDLGSLLPSKSYQFTKRILDVGLIILSLPLTLPMMMITGLLIVLESRGGMFFLQERIGQGGKAFTVYKFRSMCKDSEKEGSQFAQSDDMRVTRIGKFIRKTRIDELPQFLNVIKGEMSLIGPRPEQKQFVNEFNKIIPFYNYRHIVKPGISGWAQVVHGYAADAEDTKIKLEYDFYYIKNFSFSMDLLILFKTIQTVFTGFGAR